MNIQNLGAGIFLLDPPSHTLCYELSFYSSFAPPYPFNINLQYHGQLIERKEINLKMAAGGPKKSKLTHQKNSEELPGDKFSCKALVF